MLSEIHHLAIICSDYNKSKRFYTEVLGLEIVREVYRAERKSYKLDLALKGKMCVELFSFENAPARLSYPEACGLRHLAFLVDDLEQEVERLSTYKISCEAIRVDEYTNKRFTFFSDPDNLPIELYER